MTLFLNITQSIILRYTIYFIFIGATLLLFVERIVLYIKISRKDNVNSQFLSNSYLLYFLKEKNFETHLSRHIGWFIVLIIISLIWWGITLSYIIFNFPTNLFVDEWTIFIVEKIQPFSIQTSVMLIYWLVNLASFILFRWWRAKIINCLRKNTMSILKNRINSKHTSR